MKVGSITHNRTVSIESKGSKEKANFSDSLNLAHRAKTKEELELQMTEIKKTGEKLVATKCYGDVVQYKKLIIQDSNIIQSIFTRTKKEKKTHSPMNITNNDYTNNIPKSPQAHRCQQHTKSPPHNSPSSGIDGHCDFSPSLWALLSSYPLFKKIKKVCPELSLADFLSFGVAFVVYRLKL